MKQPLAHDLKSRDGDTGQDARLVNAYVDVKRGIPFVSKRPALEAALEIPTGTGAFSTLGQALYVWQEVDVDSTTLTTSVVGIRGDRGKKAPDTKALLYFTTQPSNGSRNTAISPSIVVTARDVFGSTKTDFTGNVTLSFATNRYAATLGGTLTVAAVAGVATFSNVQVNRSGIGFALRATATGAKQATSSTFDVPTALVFTTQPPSVGALETFSVVVASQDTAGNTDTNYNGSVTIELIPNTVTLSGTKTVTAVNGVATFTGLSIAVEDIYGLVASGTAVSLVYPPSAVASNTFTVGSFSLTIENDATDYDVDFYFGLAYGIFPPFPSDLTLNITVNPNVIVYSSTPGQAGVFFGPTTNWPGSPTITLTLGSNAQILGIGGANGGSGANTPSALNGTNGGDGGDAIDLQGNSISIANGGYIFGGGGAGGGGGGVFATDGGSPARASGGGGGGGAGTPEGGSPGGVGPGSSSTGVVWTIDSQAANGADQLLPNNKDQAPTTGGVGAVISNTNPSYFANGGDGGDGGNYGQDGQNGTAASGNPTTTTYTPGLGGAAGKAVNLGGGSVTWISGNNGTQVKGAVA